MYDFDPSPKFHIHPAGIPVLLSVNLTFNGAFPEVGDAENEATGFDITFIYPVFVTVPRPAAFFIIKLTV